MKYYQFTPEQWRVFGEAQARHQSPAPDDSEPEALDRWRYGPLPEGQHRGLVRRYQTRGTRVRGDYKIMSGRLVAGEIETR